MAARDLSLESLQSMKVTDLKKELKSLGLSTTGNKNDLIERLQQALGSDIHDVSRTDDIDHSSTELEDNFEGADNVNEDEVLEDDVLLADDHKHQESHEINEEELLATKLDGDISALQQDLSTPDLEEIAGDTVMSLINIKSGPKENGNSSTGASTKEESSSHDSKAAESMGAAAAQNKELIPKRADPDSIRKLSQSERLALRAKRFNMSTPVADDAKLKARAERFGIQASKSATQTNSTVTSNKVIGTAPVDFDRLKKRAERFGTSVSAVMKQIEEKEKILKRKQRFGASVTAVTAASSEEEEQRKKMRAERFALA